MLCFLKVEIRLNHRGEEGRLRPSEVVSAVGIQDRAVMIYLKEKILNHSSRQLRFVVPEEPSDNEITVPTVHFIESATGNHVRVWQEEQPVTRNILGLQLSHMSDGFRQFLQSYLACLNAP